MNERTNERMSEWRKEWMNEWRNEGMKGLEGTWRKEAKKEENKERMKEAMNECRNAWKEWLVISMIESLGCIFSGPLPQATFYSWLLRLREAASLSYLFFGPRLLWHSCSLSQNFSQLHFCLTYVCSDLPLVSGFFREQTSSLQQIFSQHLSAMLWAKSSLSCFFSEQPLRWAPPSGGNPF